MQLQQNLHKLLKKGAWTEALDEMFQLSHVDLCIHHFHDIVVPCLKNINPNFPIRAVTISRRDAERFKNVANGIEETSWSIFESVVEDYVFELAKGNLHAAFIPIYDSFQCELESDFLDYLNYIYETKDDVGSFALLRMILRSLADHWRPYFEYMILTQN